MKVTRLISGRSCGRDIGNVRPAPLLSTGREPGNGWPTATPTASANNPAVRSTTPILLVAAESSARTDLEEQLRQNGYEVVTAGTGRDGFEQVLDSNPAALLLDLGVPDIDGVNLIGRIREWSMLPILALENVTGRVGVVAALDAGANDYLPYPAHFPELAARLRTATRVAPTHSAPVFRSGKLVVDLGRRLVELAGRAVKLSATEYSLLALFVRHAGLVLTHDEILETVWGPQGAGKPGYLRVYMNALRKKLELPTEAPLFQTESAVGYRLLVRKTCSVRSAEEGSPLHQKK